MSARYGPATREAAQVAVPYNLGADGWSATPTVVDKVKQIAGGSPGLSVYQLRWNEELVVAGQS